MAGKMMYIVKTSLGKFPITRPKLTIQRARYAAENQISRGLLDEHGIPVVHPESKYSDWIRSIHPEIIQEAQEYIGEIEEIELLDDETPREFRLRYCGGHL